MPDPTQADHEQARAIAGPCYRIDRQNETEPCPPGEPDEYCDPCQIEGPIAVGFAEQRERLCCEIVRRANGIAQRAAERRAAGKPALSYGPTSLANLLAEIADSLRGAEDWRRGLAWDDPRVDACPECMGVHGPGNSNPLCPRAPDYRGPAA